MSVDAKFESVPLPDGTAPADRSAVFRTAQEQAQASGRPVVVSYFDPLPRQRSSRVHLPSGRSFDVHGTARGLTIARLLSTARRSASTGDGTAALVLAFTTEHLGPSAEDVATLTRFVELAARAATCDHEHRCCRKHDTHSTPHIGCILR